jgi:hypothetical protein
MFDFGSAFGVLSGFRDLAGVVGNDKTISQEKSGILPGTTDESMMANLEMGVRNVIMARVLSAKTADKAKAQANDILSAEADASSQANQYLASIKAVRAALERHQEDRWRVIVVNMTQTEKFEVFSPEVVTEEFDTGQKQTVSRDPNAHGQRRRQDQTNAEKQKPDNGKSGLKRRQAIFSERVRRDYEFTEDDTRVQHLIFVAELAGVPHTEAGVAEAKAFLLGSYFDAHSTSEKVKKSIGAAKDGAIGAAYRGITALQLGAAYDRIAKRDLGQVNPEDRREILFQKAYKAKAKKTEAKIREHKKLFSKSTYWTFGLIAALVILICFYS